MVGGPVAGPALPRRRLGGYNPAGYGGRALTGKARQYLPDNGQLQIVHVSVYRTARSACAFWRP